MTRSAGRNSCCRLLTTSEILPPFRSKKIALNSFYWKILPVTLTRSRFCGASCKTTQRFQGFRGMVGEGGTPVVSGWWPVPSTQLGSYMLVIIGSAESAALRPCRASWARRTSASPPGGDLLGLDMLSAARTFEQVIEPGIVRSAKSAKSASIRGPIFLPQPQGLTPPTTGTYSLSFLAPGLL
jgi:hypothetical protein